MATLMKHNLTLETEPNEERDCNNVWVMGTLGYSASYAVAVNEGTLDNYVGESKPLNGDQLEWLNSQEVQDWLDAHNY